MDKKELVESLKNFGLLKSKKVEEALLKVSREKFVGEENEKYAYDDIPLSIGHGQTISAPHMVAVMTEALDVIGGQKILEIGAGSGYQAAVLSVLNHSGEVYTIENVKELYEFSRKNLKSYKNINVIFGDGSEGYAKKAPYDRIIATCGCPDIPGPWLKQLRDRGKLLAPVGSMYVQSLVLVEKKDDSILKQDLGFPCAFVPLKGRFGWK